MANSKFNFEPGFSGSQSMLSEIMDLAPYQVALLDAQLRYRYTNSCFAQFHGHSRDSLLLKTLPESSPTFFEKIRPFLDDSLSGRRVTCEIQLLDAQQKLRWLEVKLIPDTEDRDKPNYICCFVADITDSRKTERLTKMVFDHVPVFVSLFDRELKFRFANKSLLDSLGMREEEVIGRPANEILDPQSFAVAKNHLLRALEGEESAYENIVTRRDGTELNVLVHLVPEKNSLDETTGICALLVDTSALIKTQKKLHHNELRIQTAVDGSSVGIIEFDPSRSDWVFTEHIESLLALEPGSLQNSRKLVRERIHPDDMSVNDEAKRLEEHGFDTNIEMRLRTSSGDYRWFSINSRFKTNDDGKSKRIIGTISDIDELKKAQLQAAEDVQRRDEFLAMLSHELRNPLAAITFSLDWLQSTEETLEGKTEKLLDVISRQTDHMSKLLRDLLDVSRVTQNRIDYHFDVHDLNQSIRDVVDSILPAISGKHQQLVVNMAPEPLMVKGDVIRLKQALANLLDNASKYTPEYGKIWLQTEKIGEQVVFSVRDSGFGIEEEALNHIFDLFFQGGQPTQDKTGGIGVGLYLVDQIVHAHGGSIAALSDGPGQGSKFTICLPFTDEQGETKISSRSNLEFHGCRAIVVEDNDDTRVSLSRLLRQRGFEVTAFGEGESAANQLDTLKFDIAIIDIELPGKNGLELAQDIRQLPHLNRTLLIALTGYDQPSDRNKIRSAGFDAHIVKPADFDELCETIAAKLPQ